MIPFLLAGLIGHAMALPAPTSHNTNFAEHELQRRCGTVQSFYNPTKDDWVNANTDNWLQDWIKKHDSDIKSNANGLSGYFGVWAMGNPGWNCHDDGDTTSCGTADVCDNRVLNDKGDDIQEAYYVLESLTNLHQYFTGLREAFETSAIASALAKDQWASDFYRDKDVDDKVALFFKNLAVGLATAIGVAGAFFEAAGAAAGALASGAGAILSNTLSSHADDSLQKAADLGAILSTVVIESVKTFTASNNELMKGNNVDGIGNIGTVLNGGAFVDFPGVDKNSVVDKMNSYLTSKAINHLWRQQKVFIMGGGSCDDGQGIGQGPQNAKVCRDGKAWYLYWWEEHQGIALNSHKWGWVSPPLGSDKLGSGNYGGLSVTGVIEASLNALEARTQATGPDPNARVRRQAQNGESQETFTIPVCDVGATLTEEYKNRWPAGREWILQDYGHESRPVWCGPICGGDKATTEAWIKAANMEGFQSPRRLEICGFQILDYFES